MGTPSLPGVGAWRRGEQWASGASWPLFRPAASGRGGGRGGLWRRGGGPVRRFIRAGGAGVPRSQGTPPAQLRHRARAMAAATPPRFPLRLRRQRNRAVGSICSRGRVASAGPPAAFCDKPPGVLLWVKAKHACVAQPSKAHIAMVRLLLRTYTF